ncbi:flavohemoglobin expression-modulating QEGLA motif protein [Anaeromyxobacter oryzae]|uniref:flavohemoglobin expression-modulating QEGLA motif protein n=1 Tax=Anaeromyxobacter oryzae TaxID=2918170 RepID=UPI0020BDA6F0|nr:flavohemoglobin expression-modulating QEGLA motif protein [Anaeromyxobacter oryzae]
MPREYLRRLSDAIVHAQRPIRVLRAINWAPEVHARFFRHGARELPRPEYPALGFDTEAKVKELRELRRRIRGRNPVEDLLRQKCDEFILLAQLLAARGSRRFYELSRRVYGDPRDRFPDHNVDNLGIARMWASRPRARDEEQVFSAEDAASRIAEICAPLLGGHVQVLVRTRLTANAAAGATGITLRKGARFSERQVSAMAHHEGLWHVLTSLNGYRQPVLTVLGVGLPRHTESQEGGGIVAEFLTGYITDERYIELGERTIAIDMAARGADFLEVYRYLLARFPPEKAALMSERVFRGGLLEGGAPFTKDAAYQRGYCRTFNFLRAALEQRDVELVRAFLAGKMSVDDAELVRDLVDEGLCVGPVYLPEWFIDIDRLNAMCTHSVTMNRFSLPSVSRYYARRRGGGATGTLVGRLRESAELEEELAPRPAGDEGDLGE